MSTGKRLGGKEAAAKGRFLNHLNFGYAKHIKVREKPSEDALEQMLRTNISKEVIDRYCNGIEFDCMSCMVHAICMKNLNGGLEIYSDIYCQSPVTFAKKGLTFIKRKPQKDIQDSHLLLFADYIEYCEFSVRSDEKYHAVLEEAQRIHSVAWYIIVRESISIMA